MVEIITFKNPNFLIGQNKEKVFRAKELHTGTQIIIWLLKHHLVIQLHTYVTLALDEGMTTSCRNMSQEELARPAAVGLGLKDIVESESGHSQNSEDISSFGSYGAGRELGTLPEGDQEIVKVQEASQVTREEILKDFTHAVIMSVPAATNVEDLTKFATLSKYLRGEHHL